MAAQVGAKKRGLPPATSTAMGKNDQWVGSGLCRSMAYSHLAPWRAARRNREDVLGCRGDILARVLRGRGIPDLTSKQAVPRRIHRLDRTRTNRKSTSSERIVLASRRS